MTVLVLDGERPASLAMVRSLGRRGIDVHVGAPHRYSLSSFSRYSTGSLTYADPDEGRQQFVDNLEAILRHRDYEVVFSAREATTIPLSRYKPRFEEHTTVPFPDWETMEPTVDKFRTFEVAADAGVPMPETYFIDDHSEYEARRDEIELPAIVKPRSKTTWVDGSPVMVKVTDENYVHDRPSMDAVASKILERTETFPIIQEYIPGEGYGVEVLYDEGVPKGTFMHRRLREYPVSGGASTLRESFYREDMEQFANDLMRALEWDGVAMVEFRLDERDDTPKLIEVNGRFWGSLPLAIAAGADFPYLLYEKANGGDVTPFDYDVGVKCRCLFPGDLLWFASSLRRRSDRRAVLEEFLSWRGMHYDVVSRRDPLPVVGAVGNMAREAANVVRGEKRITGETKQ